MEFEKFSPSPVLKQYVDHFYLFRSTSDTEFADTVFPSGNMEIIFNLGEGTWESMVGNKFQKTPPVELWGQITKPLLIKSKGRHTMLGVKFLTHSAFYFFKDEIGLFNNQVSDLTEIIGNPVKLLHAQLLETTDTSDRIALIENFLLRRLVSAETKSRKLDKVAKILSFLKEGATESNMTSIASNYGISTRYLHRLIYQHTGLSPKSFNKINRFQSSLRLISKNKHPFTSIAYSCGYFDQSHFIRDFKSFTNVTPSAYLENKFPINHVFLQ